MKTQARQPTAGDLQELLAGLLPDAVEVSEATIDAPSDFVASYEGDDGTLLAVFCADLGFVAGSGAGLGMFPPQIVEDAVKSGTVSDTLSENFGELANITASLLSARDCAHVRLVSLDAPMSDAQAAVQELAKAATRRSGFEVSLGRYGSGHAFFALT